MTTTPRSAGRTRTWTIAMLVVLALTSTIIFLLDLLVLDALVAPALVSIALYAALAWLAATRLTWAPAAGGLLAFLLTLASLAQPYVTGRLQAPAAWEFFLPTLLNVLSGLLVGPVGVAETVRRRSARSGDRLLAR